MGGTSNQRVLNNHTEETIKIAPIATGTADWVKALNKPLIMSITALMKTTGGGHLVEKGLVTRGYRSLRGWTPEEKHISEGV